ncbi:peptidoglycan/xylan/chitin deacetylase (PgdA/CDA1 family) [Priestia aryabhattai]|uniref:polysaccharide deacetylase family protein n=1 Tax=Priestia aryabhattai TaxID=412384 RepID=UPI0027E5B73B|nr:polysaccharide deacetylase family protein [Priestia aryabhattai]MDP9726316.1 peptidoglycan/xylan/chitin deacetylase (PgdA/CDA1 family) [Priestia aryabhattai]
MNQNIPQYVALTFDDGPSAYTISILDILKRYNISATFFVVGSEVKKFPDIIQRIYREKHIIGNHTWNHPDITTLSRNELWKEINSTNIQIKKIIGHSPDLFRPPYSSINDKNADAIKKFGMTSVLWNVDSKDWQEKSPSSIQKNVILGIKKKSLIVMHDGDQYGSGPRDQIVTSLPEIITYLLKNNYRFLTVPEFHQVAYKIEKWS